MNTLKKLIDDKYVKKINESDDVEAGGGDVAQQLPDEVVKEAELICTFCGYQNTTLPSVEEEENLCSNCSNPLLESPPDQETIDVPNIDNDFMADETLYVITGGGRHFIRKKLTLSVEEIWYWYQRYSILDMIVGIFQVITYMLCHRLLRTCIDISRS